MRFCPQCSLILESVEWNGTGIFACRSCGGCWMTRAAFAATAEQDWSRFAELDRLFPGTANAGMFEGLPKPCADCRTLLVPCEDIRPGASPLSCPKCGGIWLAAGEPGIRFRETSLTSPVDVTPGAATEPAPAESGAESDIAEAAANIASLTQPAAPDEVSAEPALDLSGPADAAADPVSPAAPEYVPDVVALPPAADDRPEEETVPTGAPSVAPSPPWLPPVSSEMPDPRPALRRGGPLTAEAFQEAAVAVPPVYAIKRWCPQCRRGYVGGEAECSTCRVGLAEANYRVRCFRCGNENTISAERCWNCHAKMHPDHGELDSVSAPPPLPTTVDLRRHQNRVAAGPPASPSCGASALVWVIGGSVAAGLLMLLLDR